jgi:hypothetical protein
MTVIYNNIPANTALPYDHTLSGCENQILFRANNWGATTVVQVDSYSASDPTMKLWTAFTTPPAGSNTNWCIPCASKGEVYRFTVLNPDPLTTELFVEILEPGCCCNTSSTTCFDIPIRFTPCP